MTITDAQRIGIRNLAPSRDLHLGHSNGAGSTNNGQGLKIQNEGPSYHSWTLYTANNRGELWIYSGVTNVGRFATTGAYTVISDERRKTATAHEVHLEQSHGAGTNDLSLHALRSQ